MGGELFIVIVKLMSGYTDDIWLQRLHHKINVPNRLVWKHQGSIHCLACMCAPTLFWWNQNYPVVCNWLILLKYKRGISFKSSDGDQAFEARQTSLPPGGLSQSPWCAAW